MKNKSGAQVVIYRKQKKTRWWAHAVAFAVTGGTSALVSAPVVVSNASYNADTRRLARGSDSAGSDSQRARRAARKASIPEFAEDDTSGIPQDGATSRNGVEFTPEELAYMRAHRARQ